jgi:phosphoglycolate phosphatase-like HAD superfamily hydrolase
MRRNNLKKSVYIGDAEGDRKAARDCAIPFYFAEYGFGSIQDHDFNFQGPHSEVTWLDFRPLLLLK